MSKQDRQGARTPADLEQKYRFGKTFAEAIGLASDAEKTASDALAKAETASEGIDGLDKKLDQEEIFNRLTNNGATKGLYKEGDDVYINASYIKSGELLADLIKAGVIKSKDGKRVVIDLDKGTATMTGNLKTEIDLLDGSDAYSEVAPVGFNVRNGDFVGHLYASSIGVSSNGLSLWFAIGGGRAYLTGLSAPFNGSDATNKAYVDAIDAQVLWSAIFGNTLSPMAGNLYGRILTFYKSGTWNAAMVEVARLNGYLTDAEANSILGT